MTQTPAQRRENHADTWHYLLILALVRMAVSGVIGWSGLVALSDDDYARITIAQRAASDLRFDPSGTSWLPFPFWVTGGIMKLLDPSLDVARLVTVVLAVAATWILFAAGRRWGFSSRQAFMAATLAAALPVSAVLGSVAVPEFPTAALVVFAVVAVTRAPMIGGLAPPSGPAWSVFLAGAAMTAATLSRYEAWPIAVVIAVLAFRRPGQASRWQRAAATILPVAGPLLWMIRNQVAHGDAFSFLRRVASYRAALGPYGEGSVPGASYVGGVVSGSPGIMLGLALAVWASLRAGDPSLAKRELERFVPWLLASAALVGFLVVGEVLGGAPTHHPERALLLVWLLAALALVDLASRRRIPRWAALAVGLLLAFDYRRQLASSGVNRHAEETVGVRLRSLAGPGERVFAATTDYGYFAIAAAFARPSDITFDTHDPRVKGVATLLSDPWNAVSRLKTEGASWLVAPSSIVFPLALHERSRQGRLAIYELESSR